MASPPDNRMLLAVGAGLALLAAVVLALWFGRDGGGPVAPPPASKGGLTVDVADAPALETTRELRCFVAGRFVGLATLAECAQRNGLATDALDVGIDETGALAAAPTASMAPPPALPTELVELDPLPEDDLQPLETTQAPTTPTGQVCLRFVDGDWRAVSPNASLQSCVQALYAGTCVRPGDALYGRFGDVTLRLVPGRVERSDDNTNFRTLVEQDRRCNLGPID